MLDLMYCIQDEGNTCYCEEMNLKGIESGKKYFVTNESEK